MSELTYLFQLSHSMLYIGSFELLEVNEKILNNAMKVLQLPGLPLEFFFHLSWTPLIALDDFIHLFRRLLPVSLMNKLGGIASHVIIAIQM